jgi:hypothetical protein
MGLHNPKLRWGGGSGGAWAQARGLRRACAAVRSRVEMGRWAAPRAPGCVWRCCRRPAVATGSGHRGGVPTAGKAWWGALLHPPPARRPCGRPAQLRPLRRQDPGAASSRQLPLGCTPPWCRRLAYSALTRATRVRVPAGECLLSASRPCSLQAGLPRARRGGMGAVSDATATVMPPPTAPPRAPRLGALLRLAAAAAVARARRGAARRGMAAPHV